MAAVRVSVAAHLPDRKGIAINHKELSWSDDEKVLTVLDDYNGERLSELLCCYLTQVRSVIRPQVSRRQRCQALQSS